VAAAARPGTSGVVTVGVGLDGQLGVRLRDLEQVHVVQVEIEVVRQLRGRQHLEEEAVAGLAVGGDRLQAGLVEAFPHTRGILEAGAVEDVEFSCDDR